MGEVFTFERVQLDPDGALLYPHLAQLVGEVQAERRHPFLGRCAVTRFKVGSRFEWAYVPQRLLTSVEGLPAEPMIYEALTLWQVWAMLVIWGEKEYETRGRLTHYRGLLAIHAAARKPRLDEIKPMSRQWFDAAMKHQPLHPEYYLKHEIPLGAMLGIVKLVDCQPVESVRIFISAKERAFGDYSNGRFAYKLEVVEVFEKPYLTKGKQGRFKWRLPAPEGIAV